MVSFVQLRDADPQKMTACADAWGQLATDMAKLESRVLSEVTGPLRGSGWAGRAADAALVRVDKVDDNFELSALQNRNVAAVMRKAGAEFINVHRELHDKIGEAGRARFRVDDQGQVHAPQMTDDERHDPDGQAEHRRVVERAQAIEDEIGRLVSRAGELDGKFADALRNFGAHFAGTMEDSEWNDASKDAQNALALMGMSENDIPKAGGDPKAAAAWWASLNEEQRSLYLAAYPGKVGALDGLPTPARDEANRHALRNLIGQEDLTTQPDKDSDKYKRLTKLLDQLENADSGPAAQRLYLLGIDNQADGRAIVSVGNPDTARHTAVVVPGINTELDDMGGQIGRAGNIRQAADDLTSGTEGDVAVVAWLGYDTPGSDASAMRGKHAEAGAPPLDRFVDGLRASHEGDRGHMTVVGHSYGSTFVGTAASHGDGLAADDIVVAGSPGMRVDNVSDLKIDSRHVWAGAAEGDDVSGWMSRFAHNTEPHKEEFGANRYKTDTTGHSDYWKPNSESLRNQARIVVGMYDRVGLEHGQAPR